MPISTGVPASSGRPHHPPEPAKPPDDPPAMTFVTKGGGDWSLTRAKCNEYRDSFPMVDVDVELRAARQWLVDNPDRRKTSRGMTSFLTSWLNRARNGNGRRDNGHDPPLKPGDVDVNGLVVCGPVDPDDPRIRDLYANAS